MATSIDDLTNRYPDIPLDIIVKWEIWDTGVLDTENLDKVSEWKAAEGTYQNKFDDVTLKELVEKKPLRLKDGKMLRPSRFYTKTGTGASLRIKPKSNYQIREVSEDKFAFYQGDEKVDVEEFQSAVAALRKYRLGSNIHENTVGFWRSGLSGDHGNGPWLSGSGGWMFPGVSLHPNRQPNCD